jgi:hypothetical protein
MRGITRRAGTSRSGHDEGGADWRVPVAEARACGVCGLPTEAVDGYCRRTQACAAARQTALYNRVKGAKTLCLACGGPLRKRYGRFHTACNGHPRRILLARLAADLALLEARREARAAARREAERARYAARKARKAERQPDELRLDAARRERAVIEAGRRARGVPEEGFPAEWLDDLWAVA